MAYTANRSLAHVFSDEGTGVWLAPKGSTLPVNLTTDPAAPFAPVGWLSDDGITNEMDKDTEEYNALQGGALIRKKVTKVTETITFTAMEGNKLVRELVRAGNAITVEGGVAKQDMGTGQNKTIERAMVIDVFDGDVHERYCISAADISLSGEVTLAHNEDMRMYEFEATVLAGSAYFSYSNDPELIAEAGA